MRSPTGNIEPFAREICERDFRRAGIHGSELAADVDRDWHCVAAQIEAGLINDNNELIPHNLEQGLAAYRDWHARHPNYAIPPMRRPGDGCLMSGDNSGKAGNIWCTPPVSATTSS